MGGNALKHLGTRRLPASDVEWLGPLIVARLARLLPLEQGYCAAVIPAYRSKPDFGDLDILVRSELFAQYRAEDLARELGRLTEGGPPLPWVRNGPVLSLGLPMKDGGVFQIDLIAAPLEWFDFARSYFAHNDTGNLMGRVAHRMGLKFGHDGLWLPLRDGDHQYRTLLVTRDFRRAIEFLGFSHARWADGFEELEGIFRFIAEGKRFARDLFPLEHRSHRARVRDAKRPTYTHFLRWLDTRPEIPDRIIYPEGKNGLPETFRAFPELEPAWLWAQRDHALSKAAKRRFNGALVSRLTGLQGKELGALMARIRESFSGNKDFRERVISMPDRELERVILRQAGLVAEY